MALGGQHTGLIWKWRGCLLSGRYWIEVAVMLHRALQQNQLLI